MGRGCPTPLLDLLVLWPACGIRDRSQGDYPPPPSPLTPPPSASPSPPPPCQTHTLNPFTPPHLSPTHTHMAHLLLQSQRVLSNLQRTRLSVWLLPPPQPPLLSKNYLSFTVFLCVASRAYGWERGKGRGMWEEPNQTTARKPGPLWFIQYSSHLSHPSPPFSQELTPTPQS